MEKKPYPVPKVVGKDTLEIKVGNTIYLVKCHFGTKPLKDIIRDRVFGDMRLKS
jgi:hypothetical protein